MKLSPTTIEVLQSFAGINNSMLFYGGTKQRILTPTQTLIAEVELADSFPMDFGIYDLSQFLGLISLFKDPEFEFGSGNVTIREGGQEVNYRYCNPDLIKTIPKDKNVVFGTTAVAITLTREILNRLMKMTRLLGIDHIAIVGDGTKIVAKTLNLKDPNASNASFDVGESDLRFTLVVSADNLRIMPHDYDVKISKSSLLRFESKTMPLTYTMSAEKKHSSWSE